MTMPRMPTCVKGRLVSSWVHALILFVALTARGGEALSPKSIESAASGRSRVMFERCAADFASDTNRFESAWLFGKAAFDWGEFSTGSVQRAEIADAGIRASLAAVRLQAKRAEGHYYLAMNRGQMARTKSLGALRLVAEMEKGLKLASSLDPRLDHAGADRSLGLLYARAPGWPASIGSKTKARHHLSRAVELEPGFPENALALMEALHQWGDQKHLARQIREYEERLGAMRAQWAGDEWAWSWVDWDARWKAIRMKSE